jgi:signal peptidase II
MDLILVYNKGVAFSMFAFLEEWLKYIQLALVTAVLGYVFYLKQLCYAFPAGLLLGGAFSNIYDRFVHGGVVDMFYWHGWPYPMMGQTGFAVFNFADIMIDVAVVWILLLNYKPKLCKS